MADPYSTQYLNATDEEKKRRLQDAEARAAATEQANQAYIGNLEAAQAANQAALDQSQQNYNNLMAKYNNDFAAMVQGESDRIRKEQEDTKTMIAADAKAAKWTGMAELAASVINLMGVANNRAVSQQYRSYSQDWMKKADQDLREHRYRMDNIRARQNALKQQQLNLQMGQAGQALARENERIKQQYNDRMALAEAQRNAALQPMDIRSKAADEAGELGLKGMQTAASLYNAEEGRKLQERGQNIDQAQFAARMAAQGLNPNGTPNEDLMKQHVAAAARVASDGKNNGDPYDIAINGQHFTIDLSDRAYDQALLTSTTYLKRDLMSANGFRGDWGKFVDDVESDKKGRKYDQETRDVVAAIKNNLRDDEGRLAITNYIKDHSDSVNEVNMHLMRTARQMQGVAHNLETDAGQVPNGDMVHGQGGSGSSILDEAIAATGRKPIETSISGGDIQQSQANATNNEVMSIADKIRNGIQLTEDEVKTLAEEVGKPKGFHFDLDDFKNMAEALKSRPILPARDTR